MTPDSRSTADCGRRPQSALPKPPLTPSMTIAFIVGPAASSRRRISSSPNSFGPFLARSMRRYLAGRTLERLPAHGPVDQAIVERELEDNPGLL